MLSRMAGEAAKTAARTYFYHDVLPLLKTYDNHVAGYNPHPSDGNVVKYGERYYRTFADIPIDEGTKEIINNLKKELKDLEDPVKNYDKIKLAYDKIKLDYDKVISKLEEEKRGQDEKEHIRTLLPNTASTFSPSPHSYEPPFSLQQEDSQPTTRDDALRQLMGIRFGTPKTANPPDRTTSTNPPHYSSLSNPSDPENKEKELFSPVRKLPF
jgi:hypothetical protein